MNSLILQLIQNSKFKIQNSRTRSRAGQSLIEVLIGLTIGALLIGTAAMGVAFMLRSTSTNDNLQSASGMVQASLDKVRSYAGADWENIYGLTKGNNSVYFLNASGTEFIIIEGKEGLTSNNVSDGLVGRWGFDEKSGTIAYDMMGSNKNGVLTSESSRATSTCKSGYCISLDGANRVDFAQTNFKYAEGSFSYWVKFSQKNITQGIFHLYEGSTTDYIRSYVNANNVMDLVIEDDDVVKVNIQYDLDNLGEFLNTWYHVAWVQDGVSIRLYINGVEQITTGTNSGSWWTEHLLDNLTMRIGLAWSYMNGFVDDFRVYSRALSGSEIKQIYESSVFSGYFVVHDVCRTNDASSTISGVTPCADGSLEDPSTQRITSSVEWNASGSITDLTLTDYVTRWKNDVFQQTDWSGGSGDNGVYTRPGTTFSTSTNVDITTGSFKIHGF